MECKINEESKTPRPLKCKEGESAVTDGTIMRRKNQDVRTK